MEMIYILDTIPFILVLIPKNYFSIIIVWGNIFLIKEFFVTIRRELL